MRYTRFWASLLTFSVWLVVGLGAVGQEREEPTANSNEAASAAEANDDQSDLPAGHSQHGEAFNAGPRQEAYLMQGTGRIQFPVTSDHPEVQPFVEQGIGQVHGFWYFEAERSFRQAAKIDPGCAIAYWGMALANANNSKRAKEFIVEAVKRKDSASDRESMYIDALDRYLKSGSNRKDKAKSLIKAYEQIVEKFPDDIEAKGFRGYALYKYRSYSGRSYDDVDRALKEVLAAEPMHPVHHFRIHLWDYKGASRVLDSSALCGQSAPGIAHMWHMPGHIYSRLKRYEDAVWQQEASARVDHAQMMRDRVMPDQIHNFAHNNEWLVRSLTYVGRWQDAADLARNMIELPQHPRYNTFSRRGSAYYGRLRLFDVLHRFERWDLLIEAATGRHLVPTDKESEQIKRLRYLGVAYAETGQSDEVRTVLADLEKRLEKASQAKPSTSKSSGRSRRGRSTSSPKQGIEKAIAAIKGHMAVAESDYAAALPLLKSAGENGMLQARIQCLAGQTEQAVKSAESYMRSQQHRTQPLAGQIEVLWHAGKKDEAGKVFAELRKVSGSIQFDSPVFERLKPIAAELGFDEGWRIPSKPRDDIGERPTLDTLGPFRWQPTSATGWVLNDVSGKPYALKQFQGKPVVVIFYLGYGCLHCTEQLQAFAPMAEKFRDAGIELIAISTDDQQGLAQSLANYEGGMPFPLVSNAKLDIFKQYRVFDDFEETPLHGTFLIDGEGLVRWQDISYEPFMDATFLLNESKRLLGQTAQPHAQLVAEVARQQKPIAKVASIKRTRINPAGISGSLVIAGEETPDDALDRFYDYAQQKKARIVILQTDDDERSESLTARLRKHWDAKETESLDTYKSKDGTPIAAEGFDKAMQSATGIWLVAEDAKRFKQWIADSSIQKELREALSRGGVLGGSAVAAEHFAAFVFEDENSDHANSTGLALLPDAIVDITSSSKDGESRIDAALGAHPGTVGYEIDSNAAMIVRGRRIRAVGKGNVRVRLLPSDSRPAKHFALEDARREADLTALRNSAAGRVGPQFPPKNPPAPNIENGTLIIIGGGGMPRGIIAKFVELAGGKKAKIIVLPTAMPDPISSRSGIADSFRKEGAAKVTVLPGRTFDVVESDDYLGALREATGIWFGGGRQWRFADAYLDTKALDLMHDVLRHGGVIMGSSAGASIQADYLARANPLGNLDIMAEGYERGLGFISGVAVDQHFAQRKRFKDMTSLVDRYPQLLGIGIDEGTAIVVQGQTADVVGKSSVHFYDRKKPVVEGKPDYESVKAGGRYELVERKVLDPGGAKDDTKKPDNPESPKPKTSSPSQSPEDAVKYRRYAEGLIKKYDANDDLMLDAEEQAKMRRSPAAADSNKDGNVTVNELVLWLKTL